MSSLPTSSIPTSSQRPSQDSYVCIGPNPNDPDGIIMGRFSQYPSHVTKERTGKYRCQMQAGHSLKDDCDTDQILVTLHNQLKQTITDLNANRPLTKTQDRQQFVNARATWKSAVESRVQQLSKDAKDSKLTLVFCDQRSEYAEALSRYSVGPFNKQEQDLLENFGLLSKNATRAEQIEVHDPSSQETDETPPGRIVKPYKPGHGYKSDPEISKRYFDGDSDQGSQRAGHESGQGDCSKEEAGGE